MYNSFLKASVCACICKNVMHIYIHLSLLHTHIHTDASKLKFHWNDRFRGLCVPSHFSWCSLRLCYLHPPIHLGYLVIIRLLCFQQPILLVHCSHISHVSCPHFRGGHCDLSVWISRLDSCSSLLTVSPQSLSPSPSSFCALLPHYLPPA